MNRIVAVKNYGFEWYLTHGLSERDAAATMVRQGIDWVAIQNLRDPLPTSDVRQAIPGPPYDDRRFRDELRARGVRVFEATAVFFRPEAYAARQDLRPIDARGEVMEPFGWYVGLCPSSPDYLAERAAVMEEVAATLQPDGVFLSFIRFPGFWERWMPETKRADIREYCFCGRCTRRFEVETGHVLPEGSVAGRAAVLQHDLRAEWTAWKVGLIASAVATLGDAARRGRHDVDVMVNGLALGTGDYGNAVAEVLGQRLEELGGPADAIELMFYHQILRRDPVTWIDAMTREARQRTSAVLLACLQGKPTYLDGLYADGRRNPTIPITEFEAALRAVAASPADGLMVYHWLDFLEDELSGDGRMSNALRAFKDGSL
jgi:SAM-dependent methyltransferase